MSFRITFLKLIFTAFVASMLLAACGDSPDKIAREGSAAADNDIRKAIESAKSLKDPWQAFEHLLLMERIAFKTHSVCARSDYGINSVCGEVPAADIAAKERLRYLGLSLEQNNQSALVFLFGMESDERDYKAHAPLRKEHINRLLAAADAAGAKHQDGLLFLVAGDTTAAGKEIILDTSRAVGYFARAWALDQPQAANRAAMVFTSINDFRNAYLWSLRCISPCVRHYSLPDFQHKLSADAAKQAQAAAANSSVVELRGARGG